MPGFVWGPPAAGKGQDESLLASAEVHRQRRRRSRFQQPRKLQI